MRLVLMWVCLLLTMSLPYAAAQPVDAAWGLPELMHELAQVHSATARFTERKTVQMLSAPLVVSGALTYVAPGYLRKITVSPTPENFILDHGEITMSGGPDHQTHVFSINDDPQIGGLVEGIRATLAGDLPTLEHFYIVRLTGTAAGWQLLLQPRDAGVTRFVKSILIVGSHNRIAAINTVSSNGDHSEMDVIEDVSDAG
jgi:hypothetical protein